MSNQVQEITNSILQRLMPELESQIKVMVNETVDSEDLKETKKSKLKNEVYKYPINYKFLNHYKRGDERQIRFDHNILGLKGYEKPTILGKVDVALARKITYKTNQILNYWIANCSIEDFKKIKAKVINYETVSDVQE